MIRSKNFIEESTVEWEQVNEGMRRQIMGFDDSIMMVKVEFIKGGEGAVHSHVHSQCSYVVSGVFEFNIDGIKKVVISGDGLFMEPNIPHGVICIEEGILIDTFSPVRADFLNN